ncbi:hypothetical protein GCM10010182_10270 [Actinomadura cremea]|nr:hypothetical protein GCM10010182_10270 [Actinomadura cremea]
MLLASSPDGRLLAVKQVHARFAADGGFRERFRREVEASRRVSGTAGRRSQFAERAADGAPESGLGFGDAAFWETAPVPSSLGGWTCVLSVRGGNLVVDVKLGGDRTRPACRTEAAEIARAAIAAAPPRESRTPD